VAANFTGVRVFANRWVGFSLAELPAFGGFGTYPVASGDGGRTWRIAGPLLHAPAAQGAIAVDQPGVLGPRLFFAWCAAACDTVVDVTPDGGRTWWQAFLPGSVLAVTGSEAAGGGLTAVVAAPTTAADGRGAAVWFYTSPTGRRWTYRYSLSVVS